MSNALKKQMESMDRNTYEFKCESTEKWKHLLKLNQVYGKAYYTQDNEIELFTDGRELFESLIDDIMAAKETINIEYYIVKRDKIGRRFLDASDREGGGGSRSQTPYGRPGEQIHNQGGSQRLSQGRGKDRIFL